jgi:hypothetical protein
MGSMKEPPARKGNAASKGKRETDYTPPNLEDFKRNHPRRGATGAAQQPNLATGKKNWGGQASEGK